MTTLNERISEEMAAERQRDLDKLQERIDFTSQILRQLGAIQSQMVALRNDLILERAGDSASLLERMREALPASDAEAMASTDTES